MFYNNGYTYNTLHAIMSNVLFEDLPLSLHLHC